MSFSWPEFWERLDAAVEHWVADFGLEAVVEHDDLCSRITDQHFRIFLRVRPEPYQERVDKRAWVYSFDGQTLVAFLEHEVPGIFERPTAAEMEFLVRFALSHGYSPLPKDTETRAVEAAMRLIRGFMENEIRHELEREPIKRRERPVLLFKNDKRCRKDGTW